MRTNPWPLIAQATKFSTTVPNVSHTATASPPRYIHALSRKHQKTARFWGLFRIVGPQHRTCFLSYLDFGKICRPLVLTLCILCLLCRPVHARVAGSFSQVVFSILAVSLNKPQIETRNSVIIELPYLFFSWDMASLSIQDLHTVRFF